ncbi:DUF6376 family protein [Niallia sp. Krafla_26]|uniref:DUF6376 family protein n=1 Tax=Niallia sp. Krafla_26 TaxID=3064703 RepID=UPI003D16EC94
MKKVWMGILISIGLVLGGCSFIEEAGNTVNYVNEATDYVSVVNDFVNEVPTLANEAITDQQAFTELETRLLDMKDEIQTFTDVQAPEFAADLHQQILDYSEQAEQGIDVYLNSMENGELDPALLENTEIFQTLEEISTFVNDIKQLGQE